MADGIAVGLPCLVRRPTWFIHRLCALRGGGRQNTCPRITGSGSKRRP